MKTPFLALLLLPGWPAAAQTAPACPVLATDSSAQAWVASVRQLPLKQQVAALQQRVACDAGVQNIQKMGVCVMPLSAAQRQAYEERRRLADAADLRPRGVILLCFVNNQSISPGAPGEWQRLVAHKKVKRVEFLMGPAATAIYGTRGTSGVVRVTTK